MHQAFKHCLAHLGLFCLGIDIFHVVTECDSTENKNESNAQCTDIQNALYTDGNGGKDVTKVRIVAEYIDDMNEEQWRMEESAQEGNSDIKYQSIKVNTLVNLCCVFSGLSFQSHPGFYIIDAIINKGKLAGLSMQVNDFFFVIPGSCWLWSFSRLALRLLPDSQFIPIISIDATHGQLNQTQKESAQANQPSWCKLSLAILNNNVIELHHINAKNYGHDCTEDEAVIHVLLTYILLFLQSVTRLNLILYASNVTKQRHDLIPMRTPLNSTHDVIPKITTQWAEYGMLGEKYFLKLVVLIVYLNIDQQTLQVRIELWVLRLLFGVTYIHTTHFFSKFLFQFLEDSYNVQNGDHVVNENYVHLFCYVVL